MEWYWKKWKSPKQKYGFFWQKMVILLQNSVFGAIVHFSGMRSYGDNDSKFLIRFFEKQVQKTPGPIKVNFLFSKDLLKIFFECEQIGHPVWLPWNQFQAARCWCFNLPDFSSAGSSCTSLPNMAPKSRFRSIRRLQMSLVCSCFSGCCITDYS